MKKLQKVLLALVFVLFGAAIAFVITFTALTHHYDNQVAALMSSPAVSKVMLLESYIDEYFVGEYTPEQLADAAAAGMVIGTGDEWSQYMRAEDYKVYQEQMTNTYVGIGITIVQQETGGAYDITDVTKGGPAEAVGVLAGDVLLAVDGTSIRGEDVTTVRNMVRGEAGTMVTITVERGSKELEFAIERQTIVTIAATGQLLENGVGYVKIENFDGDSAAHTITAVEELIAQGATSLIFDVRNNPGGYQTELVEVLDYLLPEGEVFRMVETSGEVSVDYSDENCIDLPMAVLVNLDSVSAAEFFAAALQEFDAAEIIGTQTYGKGYFQRTYPLGDGSALTISCGEYFTPNGNNLAGVGITPDIEVPIDDESYVALYYDQLSMEEDEQLQTAIDYLTK